MDIIEFANLIGNLPVKRHSVTTKYKNWESAFGLNIPEEVRELFGELSEIKISREDIFNTENIKKKIYMTIFWGYPKGMRNNYHQLIFNQIEQIKNLLENTREINDWTTHTAEVNYAGLKLSTYSKLLYFNRSKICNDDAIILDSRIINCINQGVFTNFNNLRQMTYTNASRYYPNYLATLKGIAQQNNVTEDQIELFLFLFGNNIK